ncbi:uncharacterized protein LOC18033476 isoform X1 [Citrus clementina]|uniref:uncharacterized protein LOC18033476 isoform X1 n=1 Tax=Citrus clementina TaxID=85681 RepID=UPI000CED17D4|nr:uncharacterized protein LOC18033476 isoform X1 [Citrus x clementina]XP_024043113.1 uncharacterized protein LOC18033476 isoform X1 [Citrus x clementina]
MEKHKGGITDFFNHDGLSEAVVLHDEDKQLSEVIADRDYAPKEKVWITYGKFPNSTLLLDFGFSLPYNSHNEVSFEFQFCVGSCLQKEWLLYKPDGFACKLYLSTNVIWYVFVLLRASGSLAPFFFKY